MVTFGL